MTKNIIDGIVEYAKSKIKEELQKEAEKIVARVIMDIMGKIRIEQIERIDHMRTELVFIFEGEKRHD